MDFRYNQILGFRFFGARSFRQPLADILVLFADRKSADVSVVNGVCMKGADVNFQLKGFSVEGKVIRYGSSCLMEMLLSNNRIVVCLFLCGFCCLQQVEVSKRCARKSSLVLDDLRLDLKSISSSVVVASAPLSPVANDQSAATFRFESVVPGSYVIDAALRDRRLEHASQTVTVRFGNVQLAQTIEIVAQSVVGSVFVAGNGAHASAEPISVTLRNTDRSAPGTTTRTDSRGAYRFEHVPCGTYELTASAGDAEVLPKSITIAVDAASTGPVQVFGWA